jgi:hypothetical protein
MLLGPTGIWACGSLAVVDAPVWLKMLPWLGLALILTSLVLIVRRVRRVAGQPMPTAHELVEQSRQVRGVRADLERIMVEIEQMAKRMGAQLDAKALRLEQLLAQAEAKIRRLDAGASAGPAAEGDSGTAADPPATVAGANAPEHDPFARSVYALADQGLDSLQIAQRLGEHAGKVELVLALRSVR